MLDTPALVLAYHRVNNLAYDREMLAVSPTHFRDQLEVLKSEFNVLHPADFLAHIEKGFPERSVMITFDDGYEDNYHQALPLLEAAGLTGLFYVTTSLIGTSQNPWWNVLEYLVFQQHSDKLHEIIIGDSIFLLDRSSHKKRVASYLRFHKILKSTHPKSRDEIIQKLQQTCEGGWIDLQEHRMMTEQELLAMSQSNACVLGAHTHNHPKLSILNEQEQTYEMKKSRELLERWTGKSTKHLSYPFGSWLDYNSTSIKTASSLGFDLVCANYQATVHRWTNRHAIPRFLVRDWNAEQFRTELKRAFRK